MAGMLDCDLCDWRLEGELGCFGGAVALRPVTAMSMTAQ